MEGHGAGPGQSAAQPSETVKQVTRAGQNNKKALVVEPERVRHGRRERSSMDEQAWLVLEDGARFAGVAAGAPLRGFGELVFNTAMTGYEEILTDPSYAGQIVTMTYPLIGNYGTNADDIESRRVQAAGLVMREECDLPSHWRSGESLREFL